MGQDITPQKNFFIADRSTSLTQNRIPTVTSSTTTTTKTIILNTDKFFVTDVFTTATATVPATPLYFYHSLKYFNDSLSDFANRTLLSVQFMDLNFQPYPLSEYYLETSSGKIYNNLESKYNSRLDVYEVFLVKYTIRKVSGSAVTTEIHHELISNTPVFEQATFDDIDSYGNILAGYKKYIVEEAPGGQYFTITLPALTQYAYRETPNSRIKVLPPDAINNAEPWNVRITNGHFISALKATPTSSVNYKYQIAEFDAQSFFPFPPYQVRLDQAAVWVTPAIITVGKEIVLDEANGLFTTVIVRSADGTLKYAYTNNTSLISTPYRESVYYTDGIESIDYLHGFIEVSDNLLEDDQILVSYYTSEDTYIVTNIDFNPVDNLASLHERVVLYVVPETADTGMLSQSLYYLTVDPLGRIKYSSQAAAGALLSNPDTLTTKMLNEDFLSTGDPKHTFYYDRPSTPSGLDTRLVSGVWTTDPSEFSFVDKYSVESVLFKTLTTPSGVQLSNFIENGRVLLLADIYTGEGSSPDSLTSLDVRVQGGGIKDEFDQAALMIEPEVSWYLDHNSAKPYPSVGAFFAEIPQSILEDYGGAFTYQQVVDIVSRHMKAGGYPVVRSYGIDPVLTAQTSTQTTITINWPSYGPINYNVYKSTSSTYGFALEATVADTTSGNSYTITGLTSGYVYYIKISAIDADGYESFSQTIAVQTAS